MSKEPVKMCLYCVSMLEVVREQLLEHFMKNKNISISLRYELKRIRTGVCGYFRCIYIKRETNISKNIEIDDYGLFVPICS